MKFQALVLSALAAVAWAVPAPAAPAIKHKRNSPPLPSEDPFYSIPDNIHSYAPGAIIDHRAPPAAIAAFGTDKINIAGSWQIRYRTTDNVGNATQTVLTVLIPNNADFNKVLSYQVAEDAASINCGPSYALQLQAATGGLLGTIVTEAELLLIEAALYQGWVVILPDHEGPSGAYLANRLAGQATLDGIRAALASTSFTGIQGDAKVTMWGYSGGSLASAWAAVLQPRYAPDLSDNIVGAAIGGTVPNINNVINTINDTPFAGIIPAGMMGLASQYPVVAQAIDEHVLPEDKDKFEKVTQQCFVPDILDFLLDSNVKAMVDNQSLWTQPDIQKILQDNSLAYESAPPSSIPLYVYKSVFDEISPIADTDNLVKAYCSAGSRVTYTRDLASEHASLAAIGAPMAIAWLIDRMDGKAAASSCSTTTKLSSLFDIATIEVLPSFLFDALEALLGGNIGPTFFG
ncbi:hypothetical protein Sste5346_007442 [Sporothrix stenoceras]|uniref:Secretory lipase n=1 Tax=Sporothrix stenoceras TaxID=5173 RepID=A0ABR3YTW4_9PEZI